MQAVALWAEGMGGRKAEVGGGIAHIVLHLKGRRK